MAQSSLIKTYNPLLLPPKSATFSFTPVSTWLANVTHTGFYYRDGEYLVATFASVLSGAPTSNSLIYTIPNSWVIDTAKLPSGQNLDVSINGNSNDAGTQNYPMVAWLSSNTQITCRYMNVVSTVVVNQSVINQAQPLAWGSTDNFNVTIRVPIVGWTKDNFITL